MNNHWLEGFFPEPNSSLERLRFVKLGALHSMRALRILCDSDNFISDLRNKYETVTVNQKITQEIQANGFSQLLMSVHFLSGLRLMINHDTNDSAALVRSAVISWYYGIYHAAKAMLILQDGSNLDSHMRIANAWDEQLASKELVVSPFDFRFSSLVKKVTEHDFSEMLHGESYQNCMPTNETEALACYITLLHGTAKWYREKYEESIPRYSDFKKEFPKFRDFRSTGPRQYKDRFLANKSCGFIHHASRFRGKVNYRDALFLSYDQADNRMSALISDLERVLSAFIKMAMAFSSKKVGNEKWKNFSDDLSQNSHLGDAFNEINACVS